MLKIFRKKKNKELDKCLLFSVMSGEFVFLYFKKKYIVPRLHLDPNSIFPLFQVDTNPVPSAKQKSFPWHLDYVGQKSLLYTTLYGKTRIKKMVK